MSTVRQGEPSPILFFETVNAYMRTEAIRAALELDVFTAIGEGVNTAEGLAKRCSATPKGARVLCDYLTVMGFLTKQGSTWALTVDSAAFLDRRSPHFQGSVVDFLLNPMLRDKFRDLTAVIRKGGTIDGGGTLEPEHPVWVNFARAMAPMQALPAQLIGNILGAPNAGPWKVLDIAAGHGVFGVTLARMNPQAQIVAQDWVNVLEVAKDNARIAGVEKRYQTLPGSAFDVDFGTGYDVALITNFLHHFDAATCEKFLRKVHAALKPGGRAVTLEFVPNEDRVTPSAAAGFSMVMLASTPSGDAYTFSELQGMMTRAGFQRSELHPLPPTPQSVVVSYR